MRYPFAQQEMVHEVSEEPKDLGDKSNVSAWDEYDSRSDQSKPISDLIARRNYSVHPHQFKKTKIDHASKQQKGTTVLSCSMNDTL